VGGFTPEFLVGFATPSSGSPSCDDLIAGPHVATAIVNAAGFKIEFLTPDRSKDEYGDEPTPMPALGGASAQPLRYLDFLIHRPVRSALLHRAGVAVLVPAPERFAVHKLIVSELRRHDRESAIKARKDLDQAGVLIEGLTMRSAKLDLGFAWLEARDRGPRWRQHLDAARLERAAAKSSLTQLPQQRRRVSRIGLQAEHTSRCRARDAGRNDTVFPGAYRLVRPTLFTS
jgi:hypothetical protein